MSFLEWLKDSSKIILGDGSNGTELMKMGLEGMKIPDILNIENPQFVKKSLSSFYESGSDMVQTVTLNANYLNLKRYNFEDKIEEINRKALENIKSICPKGKLVVGEIGPTAEFRSPLGSGNYDIWKVSYEKQIETLDGENSDGVDLWHAMGFVDAEEMAAALDVIKDISSKPIIASFIIEKKKRGFFTIMGNSIEECINLLEKKEVDVIGANCDPGSTLMVDWVKEARKLTDTPLSVKPNAGKPSLKNMQLVYEEPIEKYQVDISKMIELGVKVIGGCCGTSPLHINSIRKYIDSRK
jgi:5-methyltetrahydrofolate--homocysteine methyltransferase